MKFTAHLRAPNSYLSENDIVEVIGDNLGSHDLSSLRILMIVPDATRTMPLAHFFRLIRHQCAQQHAAVLDVLVANGTHPPMPPDKLCAHLGLSSEVDQNDQVLSTTLFNHFWQNPEDCITLTTFSNQEVRDFSGGLIEREVPVRVNRLIMQYDLLLVCGPVFPHEVAGFSGGSKYFFPGISGPEMTDFTHWLGALATTNEIIGCKHTLVRNVIEHAAAAVPIPRLYCCPVVSSGGVHGLFMGEPGLAWSQAADLSSQVHIRLCDNFYQQALAVLPEMYDDMWTGSKGMYKLEPVVIDGGELLIYAPHITEFSYSHGPMIEKNGYHVVDFFTSNWEQYRDFPWGVLAHPLTCVVRVFIAILLKHREYKLFWQLVSRGRDVSR